MDTSRDAKTYMFRMPDKAPRMIRLPDADGDAIVIIKGEMPARVSCPDGRFKKPGDGEG